MRPVWMMLLVLLVVAPWAAAQDPVEVDPDHYQVAFENERVRVLLINYGSGEESVMHEHPEGISIFLTDIDAQFTLADGTVIDAGGKAGDIDWIPAGKHQPKNTGDEAFKVYHIEFKDGGE